MKTLDPNVNGAVSQPFRTDVSIADRYIALCTDAGIECDRISVLNALDLVGRQLPLNLERLLAFPDGDFAHDVGGMFRHTDRYGNLTDCFVPRCTEAGVSP